MSGGCDECEGYGKPPPGCPKCGGIKTIEGAWMDGEPLETFNICHALDERIQEEINEADQRRLET